MYHIFVISFLYNYINVIVLVHQQLHLTTVCSDRYLCRGRVVYTNTHMCKTFLNVCKGRRYLNVGNLFTSIRISRVMDAPEKPSILVNEGLNMRYGNLKNNYACLLEILLVQHSNNDKNMSQT